MRNKCLFIDLNVGIGHA